MTELNVLHVLRHNAGRLHISNATEDAELRAELCHEEDSGSPAFLTRLLPPYPESAQGQCWDPTHVCGPQVLRHQSQPEGDRSLAGSQAWSVPPTLACTAEARGKGEDPGMGSNQLDIKLGCLTHKRWWKNSLRPQSLDFWWWCGPGKRNTLCGERPAPPGHTLDSAAW